MNGQDPSGRRATPRTFPEPLHFRHDFGCVGLRGKDLFPWCMLYANDIALCTTTRKKVDNKLEERRLNISRYKAVYLRVNGNGNLGDNLERVLTFKYLGAT